MSCHRPLITAVLAFVVLTGCDGTLDRPASEVVVGSWTAVDVRAGSGDQYGYDATSSFESAGDLDLSFSATSFLASFRASGSGQLNVSGLPAVTLTSNDIHGTYSVNETEAVVVFNGTDSAGTEITVSAPYRLQGSNRMQLVLDRFAIAVILGIDQPVGIDGRLTFRRR